MSGRKPIYFPEKLPTSHISYFFYFFACPVSFSFFVNCKDKGKFELQDNLHSSLWLQVESGWDTHHHVGDSSLFRINLKWSFCLNQVFCWFFLFSFFLLIFIWPDDNRTRSDQNIKSPYMEIQFPYREIQIFKRFLFKNFINFLYSLSSRLNTLNKFEE